tara:strand:+ start:318 stop:623 length:306 start_codon:yes stop_codon:yes gene_type:complete
MKRVFVIKHDADGVIGVVTNKKQAVKIILDCCRKYDWRPYADESGIYSDICKQLKKSYVAFIELSYLIDGSSYTGQEGEGLQADFEIEEIELNRLNIGKKE